MLLNPCIQKFRFTLKVSVSVVSQGHVDNYLWLITYQSVLIAMFGFLILFWLGFGQVIINIKIHLKRGVRGGVLCGPHH